MTPDERQLLEGLFDRIRQASDQPRDRDAEGLISDAVRAQPHAPYLLAQAVLVQDQALRAANDRLQQLESENRALRERAASEPAGQTSFLGGLSKSLFGGAPSATPPAAPRGPWGQASQPQPQPQAWGQQPQPQAQPQPWGQQPQQGWGGTAPAGGSSFLRGALGTAAGVAGGVLLAHSISNLFQGGSNAHGIASGLGEAGAAAAATGATPNFDDIFGGGGSPASEPAPSVQDAGWSAGDTGSDWGPSGGSDDSFDV